MTPTSPRDLYAGIDVGTQGVRVLLADAGGQVEALGQAALRSRRHGDRHEQDPHHWWQSVAEACHQALATVEPSRIRAVSVCSTSGTFILHSSGSPLGPAVMYNDRRGEPFAPTVRAAGRPLWERLGYPMQGVWTLPRLIAELADPAVRRGWDHGTVRLRHQGDHINALLTHEEPPTDWAQALKAGYDLDELRWPAEVLAQLGVAPHGLPEVVAPGTPIGTVHAEAAEATGLPAGALVVAGTTDSCAAQLAAGALSPGQWNTVIGTTLAIKGVTTHRLSIPGRGVYSHRSPAGGWLPGGASNVGAGYLEAHFSGRLGAGLDERAALHEPAPGLTYPLVGTGERFPFEASHITGFSSVTSDDDGAHYAAALQGIAFVERLAYDLFRQHDALVTGPISATGGSTRSPYWLQLRASVLGTALRVPRAPQPAFGMTVLAAAAHRGEGLETSVSRMVRHLPPIDPDPRQTERLAPAYRRFVAELTDQGHLTPTTTPAVAL